MTYILFDIGGSKTRIAASEDLKNLTGDPIVYKTPKSFDAGVALFAEHAKALAMGGEISGIAGGIAGAVSEDHLSLLESPNIDEDWHNKPLTESLKEATGAPLVLLENDTANVGLGEMHFGAGVGYSIGVYMTVSTGVGGARYVDGVIDRSKAGFEPGHQVIDADNTMCPECTPCPICHVVDLESMVSGSGVQRRFNKEPYEIPQNDPLWSELGEWLAYGLNNVILTWSPGVIVLGGSMIVGDPRIELSVVEKKVREILTIYPDLPKIVPAKCGDFGGLYGGMVLIEQHIAGK